jgi:uncharacterized protein (DUF4415 family)
MTKKYKKPLTPKEVAALSDSDIATDDIPELDENFWANAKLTEPRTKTKVSMRLDQDVLDFFKADNPKGFTARMAAVLTAYANAHQDK